MAKDARHIRMTARRVHERIANKVDAEVLFVIMALAEENSERIGEIIELAVQMDNLATMMNSFVHVQSDMVEKLKKKKMDDLEGSPYVQAVDPKEQG